MQQRGFLLEWSRLSQNNESLVSDQLGINAAIKQFVWANTENNGWKNQESVTLMQRGE